MKGDAIHEYLRLYMDDVGYDAAVSLAAVRRVQGSDQCAQSSMDAAKILG